MQQFDTNIELLSVKGKVFISLDSVTEVLLNHKKVIRHASASREAKKHIEHLLNTLITMFSSIRGNNAKQKRLTNEL